MKALYSPFRILQLLNQCTYSRESGVTIKVGRTLLPSGACSGTRDEASREFTIKASIDNVLPNPMSFVQISYTDRNEGVEFPVTRGHLHRLEDRHGRSVVVQIALIL